MLSKWMARLTSGSNQLRNSSQSSAQLQNWYGEPYSIC